jgi:hypothetical protein
MGIPMGQNGHISPQELDWFLPNTPGKAATPGNDVVGDQVLCPRQDLGLQLRGSCRFHDPGLSRFDRIEEGTL